MARHLDRELGRRRPPSSKPKEGRTTLRSTCYSGEVAAQDSGTQADRNVMNPGRAWPRSLQFGEVGRQGAETGRAQIGRAQIGQFNFEIGEDLVELGSFPGWPTSGQFWPESGRIRPVRQVLAFPRPILVSSPCARLLTWVGFEIQPIPGRSRSKLVELGPKSMEMGPKSVGIGPNLAESGPKWSMLVSVAPPKLGGTIVSLEFDRDRAVFQPISTRIRRRLGRYRPRCWQTSACIPRMCTALVPERCVR